MTTDYPVHVEIDSPERFDRTQIVLRLTLAIVLAWLGITMGWLVWMLFAVLPVVAAIAISTMGSERYLSELAPRIWRGLSWLLQVSAFMLLVVDQFPTTGDHPVRIDLRFTGKPTVGSALLRLLTSIPSGAVLVLLWFVSGFLLVIAMVIGVIAAHVPHPLIAFQRAVVRWQARLVAYHASFVEEYPPFAFDSGDGHDAPLSAAGAR